LRTDEGNAGAVEGEAIGKSAAGENLPMEQRLLGEEVKRR
jgi:hypothetical protein